VAYELDNPSEDSTTEHEQRGTDDFPKQNPGNPPHLWPIADVDLPDWSWLYVWLGLTILPTALYAIAVGWLESIEYSMGNFLMSGLITALFANRLHPVSWIVFASWAFVLWAMYPRL